MGSARSTASCTATIDRYALIGDLRTAGLVSADGDLAWLCWPEFDSEACFASLLGTPDHGVWSLSPARVEDVNRRYLSGTLIVETTYTQTGGAASVTDFMPIRGEHSCVVRLVRGLAGSVRMRTRLAPRFDYGNGQPRIEATDDRAWRFVSGPHALTVRSTIPLEAGDDGLTGEWIVSAGDRSCFTMQYGSSFSGGTPPDVDGEAAQEATTQFWAEWISRSRYRGAHRDAVERSLITLKALTYAPSGGIVAAPTSSLPEKVGGVRNWDYRFCWLRDSTFTLQALTECGFDREAHAWLGWLSRSVQGNARDLKIMFGIRGEREHSEWTADWLPGYQRSTPVHIGNKASDQLQLDVYGEVLDALYRSRQLGLYPHADPSGAALELPLLEHLETIWSDPDAGLWEFRTPRQHFTHSKVMAWVAFDRGIRISDEFGMKGPVARWRTLRRRIHDDVCAHGFHRGIDAFTQVYGGRHLDATALLMPLVGFLDVDDPRITGTVRAIEQHLMQDELLLRYDTRRVNDGLPAGEGAFLACSFWLIDVYLLQRRLDEARAYFEKLLALTTALGLLSEEYEAAHGLIGNFPQAFSHVGLINAALGLEAGTSVRLRNRAERTPAGASSSPKGAGA